MPGVTGKISADASDAVRSVRQFNQELERPIGIIEQIQINMVDLKVAITNATDPTQLRKLREELQANEAALARYTGRMKEESQPKGSVGRFTEGQRGMAMAMTRSTQALMGFMFLLGSFDTGDASDKTNKFRQNLLQGASSTLGFTFALKALGGTIGGIAFPIGIVLGLLTTFSGMLRSSGDEAKKAAEEGLKKYIDALDEISKRQAVIAEQSIEEQKAYKAILEAETERLDARRKILEDLISSRERGMPTTIFEEDLKRAGLTQKDISQGYEHWKQLLDSTKKNLQLTRVELSHITISAMPIPTQKEIDKAAEEARKIAEAAAKKVAEDKIAWMERMVQEQEDFDQWVADYDWNLYVETKQKKAKADKDAEEAKIKALKKEYELVLDTNAAAMNLADTLAGAFQRAGDTGMAAFMQILRVALQIARTVQMMNFGEIGGTAGTMDIFSAILGLGFAKGGYTGNLPRHRVAGVVHGGEVVFEKPIVDVYRNELLALRSSLQGGRSVAGYAGGGFVGGAGGALVMVGRVDIDNGKIFLRRQMPSYESYRKLKTR